nr:peptide chain release factor H [Glaciecola sp. MH2013]
MLLQLSAGQGPIECCKALGLALAKIEKDVAQQQMKMELINRVPAAEKDCYKSILLQFEGASEQVISYLQSWQGALLWVCQSPYRPKYKRKNWFFSGEVFELNSSEFDPCIEYKACRASGAGGQHVNTTDSAVRATHLQTGLSVRSESERSQHANKKMARILLYQKLEEQKQINQTQDEKQRWMQHWELQRGNPVRRFKGSKFT